MSTHMLPENYNPLAEGNLLEQPIDPFEPKMLAIPEQIQAEFEDVKFEYSKREALREENLRNAGRLLFIGPPGTGKTALARYLAHEMDLSFWIVRGDRMVHSLYGHEERAMGQLWDQLMPADPGVLKKLQNEQKKMLQYYTNVDASTMNCANCNNKFNLEKKYCPCQVGDLLKQIDKQLLIAKETTKPKVVFLDECEGILGARGSTGDTPKDKALTIFLQRLEGYWGDCVFIAATNMGDKIDPALWRRFDKVIEFKMPDETQRQAAIALRLKKKLSKDAIAEMAKETDGMSFSEIRASIDAGLKRAILRDEMDKLETLMKFAVMKERQSMESRGRSHLYGGVGSGEKNLPTEPRSFDWSGNA